MKIIRITYRENRAAPDNRYLHQHVEMTAELGKNDKLGEAAAKLQAKVREILYPELTGLRGRIEAVSSSTAKALEKLTDNQLAHLYTLHPADFASFFAGRTAPVDFTRRLLS